MLQVATTKTLRTTHRDIERILGLQLFTYHSHKRLYSTESNGQPLVPFQIGQKFAGIHYSSNVLYGFNEPDKLHNNKPATFIDNYIWIESTQDLGEAAQTHTVLPFAELTNYFVTPKIGSQVMHQRGASATVLPIYLIGLKDNRPTHVAIQATEIYDVKATKTPSDLKGLTPLKDYRLDGSIISALKPYVSLAFRQTSKTPYGYYATIKGTFYCKLNNEAIKQIPESELTQKNQLLANIGIHILRHKQANLVVPIVKHGKDAAIKFNTKDINELATAVKFNATALAVDQHQSHLYLTNSFSVLDAEKFHTLCPDFPLRVVKGVRFRPVRRIVQEVTVMTPSFMTLKPGITYQLAKRSYYVFAPSQLTFEAEDVLQITRSSYGDYYAQDIAIIGTVVGINKHYKFVDKLARVLYERATGLMPISRINAIVPSTEITIKPDIKNNTNAEQLNPTREVNVPTDPLANASHTATNNSQEQGQLTPLNKSLAELLYNTHTPITGGYLYKAALTEQHEEKYDAIRKKFEMLMPYTPYNPAPHPAYPSGIISLTSALEMLKQDHLTISAEACLLRELYNGVYVKELEQVEVPYPLNIPRVREATRTLLESLKLVKYTPLSQLRLYPSKFDPAPYAQTRNYVDFFFNAMSQINDLSQKLALLFFLNKYGPDESTFLNILNEDYGYNFHTGLHILQTGKLPANPAQDKAQTQPR